jgi:TP901 family phage tail tape measure protein
MADIQSNIDVNIDTSAAVANLRSLQRQISAFYSSLSSAGSAANGSIANMQQNLLNTINATGQFSAQLTKVQSTAESFTTSLEKNKLSLGQYFRYAGGASKTFSRMFKTEAEVIDKTARERVKDLQTQYVRLGKNASGAIEAIKIRPLSLDMDHLATRTALAAQKQQLLNQLLKQGSTQLLNFGKNTQWAGRQLMVGFTIPLSMLGTAAAKTFMDMEKQAIAFKRVYGDAFTTTAETAQALQSVRDLATEFTKYGVAAEKTMELAAQAAAAGKMGGDLVAQVREANRLAVLGQVEQSQALETTMSISNAFGTATVDLTKKINFLNAVENQTVTSIEDLTIAVPKAGPVIKQLGGDVEDLAFFLTAMKEGGINASEGANALKSGLASLINPTEKASAFLQGFGINVKGIVDANKGDVKGIVVDFAKALDTLDPLNRARAIEQMFGKFQFARLSTLFQNVIADGTQASKVLELTGKSASELAALASKELGTIAASEMFKFQKSIEDLRVQLAPLGETFLKIVTPMISGIADILENFNKLDDRVKTFITGLVLVVGGLGPVLLMTFGLVANGVANIIKGFALVRNLFNKTGDSSRFLGEQTDYMTQQQLEASAAASSLEQVHQKLEQRFTSETVAIDKLTAALKRAVTAQNAYKGTNTGRSATPKKYASGVISVPGPKGAGDVVPAMLTPGEAVIPADKAVKYKGLIDGIIAGNIPGFKLGKPSEAYTMSVDDLWKDTQASHATSPFAQGSPQFLQVEQKMGSLQDDMKHLMSAVSNLVVDLPKSFNQLMKAEGVKSSRFTEVWDAMPEGMGFDIAAELGGLDKNDSEAQDALKQLTKEIGVRTRQLADETNDGMVTDNQLEQATREVIDARKLQADAAGRAARALDEASKQLGQGRIVLGAEDRDAGLASGRITKKKVKGRRDEQLFTTGTDGREIAIGQIASEESSRPGALRPSSPYNPTGSYRRKVSARNKTRRLSMDDAGQDVVVSFAKGIDKASKAASPARKAIDASSRNIVDGVLQPVLKSKPRATQAGDSFIRNIGDAVVAPRNVSHLTKKVQQLVSTALAAYNIGGIAATQNVSVANPIVAAQPGRPVGGPKPVVVPVPVPGRSKRTPADDEEPKNTRKRSSKKTQEDNDSEVKKGTKNMTVLNDRLQKVSFGLMGLSGLFSMFGDGPLAELSGVVMGITGAFYALSTILEVFHGLNLISIAQKRLEIATDVGRTATNKVTTALDIAATASLLKKGGPIDPKTTGIFAKFKGFLSKIIPTLGRFGATIFGAARGVTAFLGPVGLAITALTSFAGIAFWLIGEEQKRQEKIKGFSDAVTVSTEKLNSWTDMLGLERSPTAMQGAIAGVSSNLEQNAVSSAAINFAEDDTFKDNFADQIKAFGAVKTKVEGAALLSSVSSILTAQGARPEQIDAVIQAIQIAAKNKKVKIEFASIDFSSKEGRQGIADNVNRLVSDFGKEAAKPGMTKKVYSGGRMGGTMKEVGATDAFQGQINQTSATLVSNLDSLNTMSKKGLISATEYNSIWGQISDNLKKTSGNSLLLSASISNVAKQFADAGKQDIAAQLNKAAGSTLSLDGKMFALQITTMGMVSTAADLASILKDLEMVESKSGTPQQIKDAQARIDAIKKRIVAEVAANKKAADAAREQENAGQKEKSIYEQTTESIKNKIKELYNSNLAYNKLKRAGVDSTTAVEIANDSMFAAAIAKTKVNSKEWKNLIKLINEYKAALKKGGPETDENKMKSTIDKILDMLNNKKNVIELEFKVNTEKLERDARLAQEAIDALQFQADDYEAGLTRLEEKEELINNTYDKRLEALDEIEAANQRISDQKNSELNIAQALARGDVSSAAAAIQEEQQRQAQEAFAQKKESLEKQRQAELAGLTAEVTVDGKKVQMSRIDIEKKIKDIKKQIFDIEENTLEPINERIRLLEVEKNKKIDEINNFKGLSTAAWEAIKGRIDSAQTSSAAYLKDIEDGLALLIKHKQYWDGLGKLEDPGSKDDNKPKWTKDNRPDPKRSPQRYAEWLAAMGGVDPTLKSGNNNGNGGQSTTTTSGLSNSPTAVDRRAADQPLVPTPAQLTSYKSWKTQLASQTNYLKTIHPYHKDWSGTQNAIETHKRNMADFDKKFGTQYRAKGGMIIPNYLSFGGMARGTDTVPAMLTPGEFVMSKYAVDTYGVDTMKAINSGTISGGSVYNSYEVNVNVRSDANPDQIARAVMGQIRQVNSQQLRGNRF